MKESEFQRQVIQLAQLHGFRVAHFRGVKTPTGYRTPVAADGAGFPDLVIAKRGLIIFAELKAEKGRLSVEQEKWIESLGPSTESRLVVVWRPSDWDAIVRAIVNGEW